MTDDASTKRSLHINQRSAWLVRAECGFRAHVTRDETRSSFLNNPSTNYRSNLFFAGLLSSMHRIVKGRNPKDGIYYFMRVCEMYKCRAAFYRDGLALVTSVVKNS